MERTILYVSILYACGQVILAVGSLPNELSTMKIISLIGLFIIGIGTGGIKACVSAFGGDQFKEGQDKQLQQFFSIFYLTINLGGTISTFVTPIFREDIHCLGEKTCFPVAFGVPALLMIIAVALFVCGKPFYKIRSSEGNIAVRYAIKRRCKSSEKKKPHWLDYADDKYEKSLIEEIKILFHVFVLFIPLPVFWALFDQQGSRWTLQATRLDGSVGLYHLKADQMQVLNPILIVTFIPLFNYIFYPLLDKCHLLRKPLQRITTGGILTALSFVIAGFIELEVESALPVMPSAGLSELTVVNNSPCNINIEGANLTMIKSFEASVKKELSLNKENSWKFIPSNCSVEAPYTFAFNSTSPIESMMITTENGTIVVMKGKDSKEKTKTGEPKIRLFYNIDPIKTDKNITFQLVKDDNTAKYEIIPEVQKSIGMTEYRNIYPGRYKILFTYNATKDIEVSIPEEYLKSGAAYIISIYSKVEENSKVSKSHQMLKGNILSILLQIPQYVIITAGEIMFSITGLEFSYSQSPKSMKSVIQAIWLMAVAFGNLLDLIIIKSKFFEKQSYELFLFAVLMGVDILIFAVLAYFYKYVDIKMSSSEELETITPAGRSNEDHVEETDSNK